MVSTSRSRCCRSVSPDETRSTMRSHSPVSGPSSTEPESLMTSATVPERLEVAPGQLGELGAVAQVRAAALVVDGAGRRIHRLGDGEPAGGRS